MNNLPIAISPFETADQKVRRQLCFIHIPKTAGTSFTEILRFIVGWDNLLIVMPEVMFGLESPVPDMDTYACICGHFTYQIHKLLVQPHLFLTFLREPLARSISTYQEFRRANPSDPVIQRLPTAEYYKQLSYMTLDEFANHPVFGKQVNNVQTRMLGVQDNAPVASIGELLPLINDKRYYSLNLAKERLEQFFFFGIQEKFEMSMEMLAYRFELFPISNLPKLQTSAPKSEFENLPDSVMNCLLELNDLDLDLYDFGSKLFQKQHEEILFKLNLKYKGEGKEIPTRDMLVREYWLHTEKTRNVTYTLDSVHPRGGWYRVEESENKRWMWSGPDNVSWVELPLDRTVNLFVNFHMDALTTEILESLAIYADDRRLVLVRDSKGGSILNGRIPVNRQKKKFTFTRLRFQLSHTSLPPGMDSESPGARLLGISLRKIEIFPADMQKRRLFRWLSELK